MSALKKMVLLLTAMAVSVPLWAKVELEYFYADDGTLIGRAVNGVRQNFVYDKRGQLLAVKDARGNDIERYVYDPAGNILSKTVGGVTTKYTYDKANQLLTSTRNGKVTRYEYDAAGRLIREGDKVYFYGYQDKILTVTVNGKKKLTFDYHMDGQLASAGGNGKSEEFLWDGLALIKRGNTRYVNEPYVTGGNPVIAGNDVMFNDMLGSTVSINDKAVGMTSFGETIESKAMYTGKPYVDGLGYAFLFRNYRTDLGKWQTTDPLGYPDGWNNFAYCNNEVVDCLDYLGTEIILRKKNEVRIWSKLISETYVETVTRDGNTYAVYNQIWNIYKDTTYDYFYSERASELLSKIEQGAYAISAVSGMATAVAVLVPGGELVALFTGVISGVSGFTAWLAGYGNNTIETYIETKIVTVFDGTFAKRVEKLQE